jgi:hypothetical protein
MEIRFVSESRFGEDHLNASPVWARYDAPDEIDDAVSTGIDRSTFLRQLDEVQNGNDHAMYPILRADPLPENLDLYIRADFVTPEGRHLVGCLIGTDGLVVTLYFKKDQYTFSSTGLSDLNLGEFARFQEAFGRSVNAVFPLTYKTPFRTSNGASVAGTFVPYFTRS